MSAHVKKTETLREIKHSDTCMRFSLLVHLSEPFVFVMIINYKTLFCSISSKGSTLLKSTRLPFVSKRQRLIVDRNSEAIIMNNDHVTVSYVTAPSEESAQTLARRIVENRLAACVNIVKAVKSYYVWEGKVENCDEALLIVKSGSSKTKELTEFVEKNHPYDCPEVITVKVEAGSKKYLDWVIKSLNQKPIDTSQEKPTS